MGFLRNNENYAWLNQSGPATGMSTGESANISVGTNTGLAQPSSSPSCSSVNNDCGCFYGGCTSPTAQNYDASATCDDGSCQAGVMHH